MPLYNASIITHTDDLQVDVKNAYDKKELNDKLYSKIGEFYIRREKDILPKSLPKKLIKLYKVKPKSTELYVLETIKDIEEHTLPEIQKMSAACSHVDTLHMKGDSWHNNNKNDKIE